MNKVESYLRDVGGLIPLDQFCGQITDADYIEGAIDLYISGVHLLDIEMWDYVDQLWAYLVDGLISVTNGASFSTFFPDQPIEITMEREDGGRLLRFSVKSSTIRTASGKFTDVAELLFAGASEFFTKVAHLVPNKEFAHELRELDKLRGMLVSYKRGFGT